MFCNTFPGSGRFLISKDRESDAMPGHWLSHAGHVEEPWLILNESVQRFSMAYILIIPTGVTTN